MRVGVQTITWGANVADLPKLLEFVASLGFRGVEFAQRPEVLGSASALRVLLEQNGLRLAGMTGGAIGERVKYCGDELKPDYLYVEAWDPDAAVECAKRGIRLVVHPHVFMQIHDLDRARAEMERHPELHLILDTMHCFLAGIDVLPVLSEMQDRLAAVHLKDWTPEFGRSSQSYAHGSTELGQGAIHPERVVAELRRLGFGGWLIAEQDWSRTDPDVSLVHSAEWLADHKVLPRRGRPTAPHAIPKPLPPLEESSPNPSAELKFAREMFAASRETLSVCYERVARAFAELLPGSFVTLWTYSAAQKLASLLAAHPGRHEGHRTLTVNINGPEGAEAIARKTVTRHRILPRGSAPLIDALTPPTGSWEQLVSVPILNPYNLNHVRMVVYVALPVGFVPEGEVSDDEFMRLSTYAAWATNAALDDLCSVAGARASYTAARCSDAPSLLMQLVEDVRQLCDCEGASLFLADHDVKRLTCRATTGIRWSVPDEDQQHYARGEGLVGSVWERGQTLLITDSREHEHHIGKSEETVDSPHRQECMFVPIVSGAGDVIGVMRCRNRHNPLSPDVSTMFSDDDDAVVQALTHAAVPHLEALRNLEQRARALRQQTHELQMPLVAIRAAVDMISGEVRARSGNPASFFGYDYLNDIDSYCHLMAGLIIKDAYAARIQAPATRADRVFLLKDVVAPAVHQVALPCGQRGFSKNNIRYGSFDEIPPLYVNRSQFQQVVFNLLANAIKYAYTDPALFRVDVVARSEPGRFIIRVRDWGPGIEPQFREKIFQEGFRIAPKGSRGTDGQGLGLWVVRQIVEGCGGTISLSNCLRPTEFTISLPDKLAYRPTS